MKTMKALIMYVIFFGGIILALSLGAARFDGTVIGTVVLLVGIGMFYFTGNKLYGSSSKSEKYQFKLNEKYTAPKSIYTDSEREAIIKRHSSGTITPKEPAIPSNVEKIHCSKDYISNEKDIEGIVKIKGIKVVATKTAFYRALEHTKLDIADVSDLTNIFNKELSDIFNEVKKGNQPLAYLGRGTATVYIAEDPAGTKYGLLTVTEGNVITLITVLSNKQVLKDLKTKKMLEFSCKLTPNAQNRKVKAIEERQERERKEQEAEVKQKIKERQEEEKARQEQENKKQRAEEIQKLRAQQETEKNIQASIRKGKFILLAIVSIIVSTILLLIAMTTFKN